MAYPTSMANTDFNQRLGESTNAWAKRLQAEVLKIISAKKAEGASANKILILMPPKFLEKLYSVMFACPIHEAEVIIFDELKRFGYIQMFGASVISNSSVLYPAVEVLGDLRQAKRETRLSYARLFGGRSSK